MFDLMTVTLNPALDLSADSGLVVPGPKLRLGAPTVEPGGGGVNVARAATNLGGRVLAVAALGGVTGARMAELLGDSGVTVAAFQLDGETRQSLSVTERETGKQFRFILPGPNWTPAQVEAVFSRLSEETRHLVPGAIVVLSGSQPPGVPDDFPKELVRRLPQARIIVDTSGAALRQMVDHPEAGAKPHVLRMDQRESEESAGRQLETAAESLDYAQALVGAGVAGVVILARGRDGSVLATATERLHCVPPEVPVVSTTGAGDSFTAGFALTVARGEGVAAALRMGTAAAAAAVMTPGSALCRADDVQRLVKDCQFRATP
ncbi:1-phosphofructokinase family hexose kinase [Pararhodobacter sp.]|uniref:1-phosphofructokinase family hexose kinase n=1 Tax=Pararhodobacter sp. TaxID=2127056 RepID=UPI002AFF321F|nr:1-phosphofructokinase family hexose kinase [Pararhodobacter sp.]